MINVSLLINSKSKTYTTLSAEKFMPAYHGKYFKYPPLTYHGSFYIPEMAEGIVVMLYSKISVPNFSNS